jgi:hypothetical protein
MPTRKLSKKVVLMHLRASQKRAPGLGTTSNMAELNDSLMLPVPADIVTNARGQGNPEGKTRSVEKGYAACKLWAHGVDKEGFQEILADTTTGTKQKSLHGPDAQRKYVGSRKFDGKRWNRWRDHVMESLIRSRYRTDKAFAATVKAKMQQYGGMIYHYSSPKGEKGARRKRLIETWAKLGARVDDEDVLDNPDIEHWGGFVVKETGEYIGRNTNGRLLVKVAQDEEQHEAAAAAACAAAPVPATVPM